MCVSDGRITVERMLNKIHGISDINMRDAVVDLHKSGYIECDYSRKNPIGSAKCACWLSTRGAIVISKILKPLQKDAA
jgi:hypothetical protein